MLCAAKGCPDGMPLFVWFTKWSQHLGRLLKKKHTKSKKKTIPHVIDYQGHQATNISFAKTA
jgi:hypothetical protein